VKIRCLFMGSSGEVGRVLSVLALSPGWRR
jgi:hypothetical protein